MAAGPGAETEHGALQAYYMPHPVVTQLGQPMHLDAADWMGTLGAAMRDAASQIQQSGINPAVRKTWEQQAAHAQFTSKLLKYYEDHPEEALDVSSLDKNGAEIMARARFGPAYARTFNRPAKTDTKYQDGDGGGDGGNGGGGNQKQTTTTTTQQQPVDAQGNPINNSAVYGTRYNPLEDQPASDVAPSNQQQQQSGTPKVQAEKTGSNVSQNAPAAPAGYADLDNRISNVENAIWRNPQNPAAVLTSPYYQDQDQGTFNAHAGGMVPRHFQGGGPVPPPPAPIAAGSGTTDMPQASPVAAGSGTTTMPPPAPVDQKALADWQGSSGSSLHPVIPAAAVKDYLTKNWDTRVKDVTYNPGGPMGPSYTAHTKDGGATTVPAVQIARHAPYLAGGNNLSMTMNAADQPPQAPGGVWSPLGGQQPFPSANDQTNNAIRALVAQQIANPQNLTAQNAAQNDANLKVKADAVRTVDKDGNFVPKPGWNNLPVDNTAAGDPSNPDDVKNAPRQIDNTTDGTVNFNWQVDPRSVPGRGDLTGVPYYIIPSSSSWSQFRHYQTGEEHEVLLPDGQMIKNLNDLTGEDTSPGRINPSTNKPYTPQDRIARLQEYNYRKLNENFPQDRERRLNAIRANIVNGTRVLDLASTMKPGQWSGPNMALNRAADATQNIVPGLKDRYGQTPVVGEAAKNAIRLGGEAAKIATGPFDPKVREFNNAWDAMKLAQTNPGLDPNEQGIIKSIEPSNSMPRNVSAWVDQQRALLTREISASMANREKIPHYLLQDASLLRNGLRIPEDPHYTGTYGITPNTPLAPHSAATPTPAPAPGHTAATAATPRPTPIDVRGQDWRQALKGKPVGTQFIDDEGLKHVTHVIQ